MFSISSLKIGSRLSYSFGVLSFLVAVTSSAGIYGIVSTKNNADNLLELASAGKNASDIRRVTLDERRYEKDVFINIEDKTAVLAYKEKWDASYADLEKRIIHASEICDDAEQKAIYLDTLENLKSYATGFNEIYQSILNGAVIKTNAANGLMKKFKENTYKLDANASKIDEINLTKINSESSLFHERYNLIILSIIMLSLAFLISAMLISRKITHSIISPLKTALVLTVGIAKGDLTQKAPVFHSDETGQLLSSLNTTSENLSKIVGSIISSSGNLFEIADKSLSESTELSSRNENQAAALEQTSASLDEFRSSIEHTSLSTEKANDLASRATAISRKGGDDIEKNISLMHNLAISASQINDIITVLDSITFQTNLLALNASVEAARAGEHGRGFSVVATEVRNLANRSAVSASEIRAMIHNIVNQINTGEVQIKQTGLSIRESISSIEILHTIMNEITGASKEQASSVEQIRIAIGQIDKATKQNSVLANMSKNTAEDLKVNAEHMMDAVSSFRI